MNSSLTPQELWTMLVFSVKISEIEDMKVIFKHLEKEIFREKLSSLKKVLDKSKIELDTFKKYKESFGDLYRPSKARIKASYEQTQNEYNRLKDISTRFVKNNDILWTMKYMKDEDKVYKGEKLHPLYDLCCYTDDVKVLKYLNEINFPTCCNIN